MNTLLLGWTESSKLLCLLALYTTVIYIGVGFNAVIVETDTALLVMLLNIVGGFWLKERNAYILAVASIVAFYFFVLPEHNSFEFKDYQHLITFIVMAFNGLAAVRITQSQQAELKKNRRLRGELKNHYSLASVLASKNESLEIAQAAIQHLANHYQIKAQVWLAQPELYCLNYHPEVWLEQYQTEVNNFIAENGLAAKKISDTLELHPLARHTDLLGVLVVESANLDAFNPILSSLISLSLARSEANRALTQAIETNQVEKMRNTLLAAVSHDLKTPLGSIIGSATTLNDPQIQLPDKMRRELLSSIAEEGYNLNRSLTKLLDISRFSIKTLTPKREWVEPEEMIGSALKRIERLLQHHSVELSGDPMLVSMDYSLMEQVVTNLIENAAKYSSKDTAIDVQTSYRNNHFILQVSDRGCGVAQDEKQRIFERFYRSDHHNIKGTGLGLAICKLIISAHSGIIFVTDRQGGGSTFTVEIPCKKYYLKDIYE
ncbi:ATP-binding protein [Vibrio sp. S4M6]|uniref:sensor histidine kinase n=1 Tax=Vibrio sinus TaxID=2946865 RepID=UPI00202A05B9|nr:ATP-binding protein [Vibrio sinus]MCL9781871.1 ATP-binding protein [Vibrio sinus]